MTGVSLLPDAPAAGRPSAPRRLVAALGTMLWTVSALFAWWVLVCYDLRSWTVPVSCYRYLRYPIDPSVAGVFPTPLPAPPARLEDDVKRLVPWTRDLDVVGLPWYVTTPREALAAGRGDCEAQAFLLASLLAAQGTPYTFRASFSHLWVDYPGRRPPRGESAAESLWDNTGGRYRFHWPSLPRLREHLQAQKRLLWDGLHPVRQVLLLAGWPAIMIATPRWRRRRTGATRVTARRRDPAPQPAAV